MSTDHGAGSVTKQREDGSPMEFDPYSDSFFDDPFPERVEFGEGE